MDTLSFEQRIESLLAKSRKINWREVTAAEAAPWVTNDRGIDRGTDPRTFFSNRFIQGTYADDGSPYAAFPITVEESREYNSESCLKTVGRIFLPLRYEDGEIQFGLMAQSPGGSFGEWRFSAPRASFSNPDSSEIDKLLTKLTDKRQLLYKANRQTNQNRITGSVDLLMGFINNELNMPPADAKSVEWFNAEEHVDPILGHSYMKDGLTCSLLERLRCLKGATLMAGLMAAA